MAASDDAVAIALANRSYLHRLLQRVFGDEPTEALLDELFSARAASCLQLAIEGFDENALLACGRDAFFADRRGFAEAAHGAYTTLFLGPHALPAPPWESMHVSEGGSLFGSVTLDVRRRYAAYGFRPCGYPQVADDHIGIELDFLAALADEAQHAFEQGDRTTLDKTLVCHRTFLVDHPLRWLPSFVRRLDAIERPLLYPRLARLCLLVLQSDLETIDALRTCALSRKDLAS